MITAYKTTAQLALENASIIEKTIDVNFKITFEYKNTNKVMRIIKEKQLEIRSQRMENHCELIVVTRKQNAERIFDIFNSLFEISISKLD